MTRYNMFDHNRFNHVSYKTKPRFKRPAHRLKRTDLFLTIRWKTQLRDHYNENSYYYFNDIFKGRRYQYITGIGILDTRSDTYVKKFTDDPILGWAL